MVAHKHPWRIIGESVDSLPEESRRKLLSAFAGAADLPFWGNPQRDAFLAAMREIGHAPEQIAITQPIHKSDGQTVYPPGWAEAEASIPPPEPDPEIARAKIRAERESEWERVYKIPDGEKRARAEKKLRQRLGPPMPGT